MVSKVNSTPLGNEEYRTKYKRLKHQLKQLIYVRKNLEYILNFMIHDDLMFINYGYETLLGRKNIQRGPELRGKYKQQAGMKFAPQLWTTL